MVEFKNNFRYFTNMQFLPKVWHIPTYIGGMGHAEDLHADSLIEEYSQCNTITRDKH